MEASARWPRVKLCRGREEGRGFVLEDLLTPSTEHVPDAENVRVP